MAVDHAAGTDYLVSSRTLGGEPLDVAGPRRLRAKARLGVVREKNGKVDFAYLCDGEELAFGEFSLRCPPSPTGQIVSVNRWAFTLAEETPKGRVWNAIAYDPLSAVLSVRQVRVESPHVMIGIKGKGMRLHIKRITVKEILER